MKSVVQIIQSFLFRDAIIVKMKQQKNFTLHLCFINRGLYSISISLSFEKSKNFIINYIIVILNVCAWRFFDSWTCSFDVSFVKVLFWGICIRTNNLNLTFWTNHLVLLSCCSYDYYWQDESGKWKSKMVSTYKRKKYVFAT
jgi:hypothetical protein